MPFDAPIAEEIWTAKYRFQPSSGEGDGSFDATVCRVAAAVAAAEQPELQAQWRARFESALAEKVKIAFMPAACFLSQTNQCMLSGCSPGGPGKLILGSFKVFYAGKPAARMIGITLHMSCLAPIPGPLGLVITGWPLVLVGL